MSRCFRTAGLAAVVIVVGVAACGKKEAAAPAAPEPTAAAAKPAPAPEAAKPAEPAAVVAPLPDIGMPFETFHAARLLQRCALKYGVATKTAERMAIDMRNGVKPELHLDAVLQKADPKAKPAAEVKDDHEMELAREKWRDAVRLAEGHTATAETLRAETETCLFAPEVGLIEGKTIDTYIKVFVDVTCLQKKLTTPDGKVDDVQHAQGAAKIFQENGMTAGEFSRYGVLFSRFPVVIQKAYAVRGEKCPEAAGARPTAAPTPPSAVYNGSTEGDRRGAIRLELRDGKLSGAVQWQGVPPPALDGRPQPPAILPLAGTLSGKVLSVSGSSGGESVQFAGTVSADGITGTWTNQRPEAKGKGTFKGEKVPQPQPAATK